MAIRLEIIVDDKGTAVINKVVGDTKNKLKDIEKESKVLGGSLESSFMKAQFAITGFLVATAGITAAIKRTIDYADSINDLANATGISVETLSALDYAAQQSGTTIQAVSSSLRILAQNLENAQQGNKEASEAFVRLGIDVNNTGRTLESTFFEVLDSLKDRQDRVALSTQTLGRGSLEFGSLAQEGSVGVKALMEEATKLNRVISKQQAADADAMADAIGRLNASFQGFLNSSILPMLPKLTTFIDKLTESVPKILAWGDALNAVNDIIKNLTRPLGRADAILRFNEAVERIKAVTVATQEHKDILMEETTVWGDRVKVVNDATKALKEYDNTLDLIALKNNERASSGLGSVGGGFTLDEETLNALAQIKSEDDEIAQSMQSISDHANDITNNIAGSMTSAILNMNRQTKVLQSLMSAVGRTILSELVSALTEAIAKALFFKALFAIFGGGGGPLPIVGVEGGVARVAAPSPLQTAPVQQRVSSPIINLNASFNSFDQSFVERDLPRALDRAGRYHGANITATSLGRR